MKSVASCCPRIQIRFQESFDILFAVARLVFRSSFLVSCFLGGATVAALKSEAAVDGNRKEVADRVASLEARLDNRELKTMLLVLPLCGTSTSNLIFISLIPFFLSFVLSLSASPFLPSSR